MQRRRDERSGLPGLRSRHLVLRATGTRLQALLLIDPRKERICKTGKKLAESKPREIKTGDDLHETETKRTRDEHGNRIINIRAKTNILMNYIVLQDVHLGNNLYHLTISDLTGDR